MLKLQKGGTCADNTICEVKDGKITIKGKRYSIKLPDGFYKMRTPTVDEYESLQKNQRVEG